MANRITTTRIAFAVTAIGTMLVAMAALTEYMSVTSMPPEMLDAKMVAKRFLVIFLLVLISFELALFLLHRFIKRQEAIIKDQRAQLQRYSKRLEELVGNQYDRIKRIMTQFQAITGNVPVILWAVNRRGEIKFAEGSGLTVIGLRGKDIVGKRVEDVFGEGSTVSSHVNFALAGEQISATDHMRQAWFAARYAPIKDQDGTIAGAIMVGIDVTDEFHLSKRASAAREHCRHMAEYVMYPLVIVTEDGVSLINDDAIALIGRTAEELSQATPDKVLAADTLRMVDKKMKPNVPAKGVEIGLLDAAGKEVRTMADVHVAEMNSHREILLVIKGEKKPEKKASPAKSKGKAKKLADKS